MPLPAAAIAALTSAGVGLLSGIASGLMAQTPKPPAPAKMSYSSPGVGQVGTQSPGGPLFAGRPDIKVDRSSLAASLLGGGK